MIYFECPHPQIRWKFSKEYIFSTTVLFVRILFNHINLISLSVVFLQIYERGILGKPSIKKSAVFLNIVQKALDPLLFEHLSYFAGGVF